MTRRLLRDLARMMTRAQRICDDTPDLARYECDRIYRAARRAIARGVVLTSAELLAAADYDGSPARDPLRRPCYVDRRARGLSHRAALLGLRRDLEEWVFSKALPPVPDAPPPF